MEERELRKLIAAVKAKNSCLVLELISMRIRIILNNHCSVHIIWFYKFKIIDQNCSGNDDSDSRN